MAKKPVKTGKRVKDFTLESSRGGKINTASIKDKKILLSFHPLAWTSVCARQMQALDTAYPELEKLRTVPLGISVDSAHSKAAWAKMLQIKKLHMLADFWPHGGIAKKLGMFDKKGGTSLRAVIILGKKRKVIFSKVYPMLQVPDLKEILKFLKEKMHHDGPDKAVKGKPATVKPRLSKPKVIKPAIKPAEKPADVPAGEPAPASESKDLPAGNTPDKPSDKPPET